jgi:hypothetical protein
MRPLREAPASVGQAWADIAQLDSLRASPLAREIATRASGAMERFLCEACGDVVGVYEPLVMRTAENQRTTSRAAEPELRAGDGAYFHRECHDLAARLSQSFIPPRSAWPRA